MSRQEAFITEELVLGELDARSVGESKWRYRRFVEEGLVREMENPAEAARWQAVLGSEGFLQRVRDRCNRGERSVEK